MNNLELLINIIIIILLIPTIIFAYKLNRNLEAMRQNQSSLAKLVYSLNEATNKAENSIPKLKDATKTTSGELKEVVDSAKNLKDDMMFLNERADSLADRLENVIHNGRQIKGEISSEEAVSQTTSSTPATAEEDSPSSAELELLKALRSIK